MKKRYAKIETGTVISVAVADDQNIPPHMSAWVECGDAGIGWVHDGSVFTAPAPPSQAEIDAAIAAAVDEEVASLFGAATRRDKALGEMMWQIAKAAKTNNWSWFDAANGGLGVNSKADFKEAFREIVAAL